MINVSRDIHSMTSFKRNTRGMMKLMKKSRRPLVLTVKGKAEAVLLDPVVYQRLSEYQDTVEGIRRGLRDVKAGRFRPVDEVFDEIEAEAAADV